MLNQFWFPEKSPVNSQQLENRDLVTVIIFTLVSNKKVIQQCSHEGALCSSLENDYCQARLTFEISIWMGFLLCDHHRNDKGFFHRRVILLLMIGCIQLNQVIKDITTKLFASSKSSLCHLLIAFHLELYHNQINFKR